MDAADLLPLSAWERWRLAARRAGTHSLVIWPPLTLAWMVVVSLHAHALAEDFGHTYLPAARAVLAGRSPYPPATVAAFARGDAFVYPPLTAFLAAPYTVFGTDTADALVTVIAVVCVFGILALLGVCDWRCYAIAFLWAPTYSAIQTGNVTLLLALGLALTWRWRRRDVLVAVVVGSLIALKLFLWPLLVWLVATRRYRASVGAAVSAVVLILLPWAVIGFAGLREYPHLLHLLTRVERGGSYTVGALLAGPLSWDVAEMAGIATGLLVLAAAARASVRSERESFALTIAGILLLSPIVPLNYFVFLIVVLAIYWPRFGWVWAAPLLFWVGPQVHNGASWQTAAVLALASGILVLALRAGPAAQRPAAQLLHGTPPVTPRS